MGALLLAAALTLAAPAKGAATRPCAFTLVDVDGKKATVPERGRARPLLVVFYRGHW